MFLSVYLAPNPSFQFAVRSDLNFLVRFYLLMGVIPVANDVFSPLHVAAENNNPKMFKMLYDAGLEIRYGDYLYHTAFKSQNAALWKTFFECGVPFNFNNQRLIETAFGAADAVTADRLMESGADLNSAMKGAMENENMPVIDKLAKTGAEPRIQYFKKSSTKQLYLKMSKWIAKEQLIEKAADSGKVEALAAIFDITDRNEISEEFDEFCLQLAYKAVEQNYYEIVEFLLQHLEDIDREFLPEKFERMMLITYIDSESVLSYAGSLLQHAMRLKRHEIAELINKKAKRYDSDFDERSTTYETK